MIDGDAVGTRESDWSRADNQVNGHWRENVSLKLLKKKKKEKKKH